jgi:hypothetical protein
MSVPLRERRFPLQLAPALVDTYAATAHWLRHLLERLGRGPALRVWRHAFQAAEDPFLDEILAAGWRTAEGEAPDVEAEWDATLRAEFEPPVEGVGAEEARELLAQVPPFSEALQAFSTLHQARQTTTYEALHLFFEGRSRLAEALIALHGKQGELIAYDAMLLRVAARPGPEVEPAEFLAQFVAVPEEPTIFTAGLDLEIVRASEMEVVTHVHGCEWARYFRARHPSVGYLMACSLDEAVYRAAHPALRLQRTTTQMEGGERCDFRIYVVD